MSAASRNASTGDDRTNYYETVPAQYLETMLWTHAERMARPVVDQDVFERERSMVKEELRQRVLRRPTGSCSVSCFPRTPTTCCRSAAQGSARSRSSTPPRSTKRARSTRPTTGRTRPTLIVAGNFDLANLRALVDKYFAAIPQRARPQPVEIAAREAAPHGAAPRRRDRPQRAAARGRRDLPAAEVGPCADWPALTVLDAVLSAGENSRMHRALVRTGKAVEAAEILVSSQEGGFLPIYALLNPADRPGRRSPRLIAAEIERVRAEPIGEAELREAKNQIFAGRTRQPRDRLGRAFELGEALVTDGDAARGRPPAAADRRGHRRRRPAGRARMACAGQRGHIHLHARQRRAGELCQPGADAGASARCRPPWERPPSSTTKPAARPPPPPGAAPADREARRSSKAALANGIRLVSAQTGSVPLATMSVVLPGGTATDPAGKAGLAELAAVIADKGTADALGRADRRHAREPGGVDGRFAGPDGVFFSVTAPAANLAAAGEVMADVIRNATLSRRRARARARAHRQWVRASGSGIRATLAGLTPRGYFTAPRPMARWRPWNRLPTNHRSDLVAWREANWHPATAQVVVSGGIAPAEAQVGSRTAVRRLAFGRAGAAGGGRPCGRPRPRRARW